MIKPGGESPYPPLIGSVDALGQVQPASTALTRCGVKLADPASP